MDIEHFKSAIAIENILMPYKKGRLAPDKKTRLPKEPITPEICMEILKSTNYARNIKDMLQCIADLPQSEQAQFKDVVLSCFDNREQPTDIFQLGQELAEKSGYGIELAKLQKIKDGPYLFSEVDARKCEVRVDAYFEYKDFSAYDKVIFLSDKKIYFDTDVKFPKNMDFASCDEVNLSDCDLSDVQSIRFKDGAKVNLSYAGNLPPNLDFSMCSRVDLEECDLSEQPNLRFKEGASVDLSGAKNLPVNLDVSCCDEVNLGWCDLSEQPNLRFKDGAKVKLLYAKNLPADIDFSMCDVVSLSECDLSKQSNLRFKNGAKVYLNGAKNLPSNLDFSICDEVDLHYCNLSRVQKLVFKNRQQMKKSQAYLPDGWKGKLVFTDEVSQNDLNLAREKNLASSQVENGWSSFVGKIFGKGSR